MKRASFGVRRQRAPENERARIAMQRRGQELDPIAGHRIVDAPGRGVGRHVELSKADCL
jgi:hypothetical protein